MWSSELEEFFGLQKSVKTGENRTESIVFLIREKTQKAGDISAGEKRS